MTENAALAVFLTASLAWFELDKYLFNLPQDLSSFFSLLSWVQKRGLIFLPTSSIRADTGLRPRLEELRPSEILEQRPLVTCLARIALPRAKA